MESDMISRSKATSNLMRQPKLTKSVVRRVLIQTQSVDAVEVVRCKNCKHRDGALGQPNILCYQMHDDDFCSYGERKSSNE